MSSDEHIDIACPECLDSGHGRRALVLRTNRESGHEFLGCQRWPDCRYTQRLPEWVLMRRAGAAMLPGFGD